MCKAESVGKVFFACITVCVCVGCGEVGSGREGGNLSLSW